MTKRVTGEAVIESISLDPIIRLHSLRVCEATVLLGVSANTNGTISLLMTVPPTVGVGGALLREVYLQIVCVGTAVCLSNATCLGNVTIGDQTYLIFEEFHGTRLKRDADKSSTSKEI